MLHKIQEKYPKSLQEVQGERSKPKSIECEAEYFELFFLAILIKLIKHEEPILRDKHNYIYHPQYAVQLRNA